MTSTPNLTTAVLTTTDNSTSSPGGAGGSEEGCAAFLFYLYAVLFGAMAVCGLVGNTLSFLVLQWERNNYVATFLLQVMAVADNFFLLASGYSNIFVATIFYWDVSSETVHAYNPLVAWPLVHISQMGTVWVTVLIAFNRYIAICRPFQAHRLCTKSRVHLQVVVMCVLIVLYNLPRFFEFRVQEMRDKDTNATVLTGATTDLKDDARYNIVYESLFYCLFVFLTPLVILVFLNFCLIRELMRARRRLQQRSLPGAVTSDENSLTLVMIVIVVIFLVCQTPGFINQLLANTLPKDSYDCGKPYFYYYHSSNIVISANSCVNFVVYCIFRKQFRQRLYAFCCDRSTHLLSVSNVNDHNGRSESLYSRPTHL